MENIKKRLPGMKGCFLVLQVISMIMAVIYTFWNERKLIKEGKCVEKIANGVLILAIVLEGIFLMCNIGAALDYMSQFA